MKKSRNTSTLARARAALARLSHLHKSHRHGGTRPTKRREAKLPDKHITPPSTPSSSGLGTPPPMHHAPHPPPVICMPARFSRLVPRGRTSRTRSDMHDIINTQAMQSRLAELEMTELENSSLRLQVDDLQRALDGFGHDERAPERVGELEMADIENSALRLQVECLEREIGGGCYAGDHVIRDRLAWLNVDPV